MPQDTSQLTLTGRILLWTLRHWLRAQRQERDLPGYVLHTVAQLPDGEALRERTEALLAHLLIGSARPFASAAPDAGALTNDEVRFLLALHACRLDLRDEARRLLSEQQGANGLRATTSALVSVEACLRVHGLSALPVDAAPRTDFGGDLPETSEATAAGPSGSAGTH